ncbi:MAG: putative sulfate/molybdate transporter [Gemmataceae bacterium]|nr:putative sulfate/molybdate transporter [Gemmataceae bacterium]
MNPRIRFDRHEFAGSFGDLGTTLPLIVGLIPAAGLDPAGVLITFGLLQIATGLAYGLPMPVQPLKAMAVLVIASRYPAGVLHAAGFAIGALMLFIAAAGLLGPLARLVPRCVVRGLQVGLGFSLAQLALRDYVPAHGTGGYALAAAGFLIMIVFAGRGRFPAGLLLIGLGVLYAVLFRIYPEQVNGVFGIHLPTVHGFTVDELRTGLLALVPAQLALSFGNSIVATERTVADLFPDRRVTVRRLGITYGLMNLVAPWFGGIPVCHGCGGLAGHHALGARTGGSVVLSGSYYLIAGLFFSRGFGLLVEVFPQPILGVVLLFEALALVRLVGDEAGDRRAWSIALVVALIAFALPQGYAVALVVGTLLWRLPNRFGAV